MSCGRPPKPCTSWSRRSPSGGEVIIYAPHLDVVSHVHGHYIYEIGYHILPYFLNDWERFKHIPLGVLAHSTHVRGSGVMENGVEKPNVRVTLASKISAADCARLNLGYLDPAEIDIEAWQNREDEGILYVPRAGEILYRLARLERCIKEYSKDWSRLWKQNIRLGILGLGVMGRSLAQNFARNGYPPIGYDLAPRLPEDFDGEGHQLAGRAGGGAHPAAHHLPDGSSRCAGGCCHRLAEAVSAKGRSDHRWRQLLFRRYRTARQRAGAGWAPFHRDGCLGRRERGVVGSQHDARRFAGGLAARPGDVPGHCCQSRRWRSLRGLDGPRRRGSLCQDGAQRHRVRRHAVDRRDL